MEDLNNLEIITCFTLVDVSYTKMVHDFIPSMKLPIIDNATQIINNAKDWERSVFQNSNFEMLLQGIGMLAQPFLIRTQVYLNHPVLEFGSMFTGEHNMWSFTFGIEFSNALDLENEEFGRINKTITGVPFVDNLKETAKFNVPLWDTSDPVTKNIYFKYSSY